MRRTFIFVVGLFASTAKVLAQQSFCEIPQIRQIYLDSYVCGGLIDCTFYGANNYQEMLALTDQNIRDRVDAILSTPGLKTLAQQNEAGAKYVKMRSEILFNSAVAVRKVIRDVKIRPLSGSQGTYDCAVLFDFDLDSVATMNSWERSDHCNERERRKRLPTNNAWTRQQ